MPGHRKTALIIGAGMQGCSIALFLAKAGWKVVIIEKNQSGRHASGVNAGGLRLLMRDWREYQLSQFAMEKWADLKALVGEDAAKLCEVRLGTSQIAVALDEAEWTWARARVADMQRRGLGEEELLTRVQLRRLLPGISQAAVGGVISRRDGHANPAGSARAFREAAKVAGATILENCRVLGLDRTAGGSWKVETSTGGLEGDILINSAGAWGRRVAALAGEDLPLEILALSMMVTIRVQPFIAPVVIGIDRPLSFKQSAAGTLVIGGGILGKACPDQDTSFTVMDRMSRSAAATVEAFPGLAEIPVLRTWTGLEGTTPDGIPFIGPSSKYPDLWHVFGFCGHGFQLAPGVGEMVARSLIAGKTEKLLAPFVPDRFEPPLATSSKGGSAS